MNSHYLQTLLAFLIAQLLMASINVYFFQKNKEIEYLLAAKTYFKAEIGYFVIGIISIFAILFILSDFIDLSINRADLLSKESLTWKETLQAYFKTSAFAIGAFVQVLAFKFKDKGKKAIEKMVDVG